MNPEIISKLQNVFRMVFQDNNLEININYTAKDIPGWDSLTHMTLINAIEQTFGIIFTFDEVTQFQNINDIVKLLEKNLN